MPGVSGVSAVSVLPFGGGGLCDFELLARFNAANQGYANAQILDTVVEGVERGRLTVVELDGVAELLNNRFRMSQKTVSAYNDLGFHSTDIVTRALGKALLATFNGVVAPQGYIAWNDNPDVGPPAATEYAMSLLPPTDLQQASDTSGDAVVSAFAAATDYVQALVLGGYDANQQPWYDGAVGTFIHGCAMFIRDGAFADWTLLWRFAFGNAASLYPAVSLRTTGDTFDIDDLRVPMFDYRAVHQPVNADWFTDINGTSLDAHVPDVGGMWTERSGDWDIQGNQANSVGAGGWPGELATVSGLADFHLRGTVVLSIGSSAGLVFRYSDNNNFWYVRVSDTANQFQLYEMNGGVPTVRAAAALAIVPGVAYEITVITDGQDMQAFLDGTNRLTFSSAFNQNAALCGINAQVGAGVRLENFHINRRAGTQYNILSNCG